VGNEGEVISSTDLVDIEDLDKRFEEIVPFLSLGKINCITFLEVEAELLADVDQKSIELKRSNRSS